VIGDELTISIAWTRKVHDIEQLVFVSDSRIGGGKVFDACPKMLALPRNDCGIAFAGLSGDAFSMMIQLSLAIEAYPPAKRRGLELPKLRTHALRIFNGMLEEISSEIKGNPGDAKTDAAFLFGGYSWRQKGFELWSIIYDEKISKFVSRPSASIYLDLRKKRLASKAQESKRYLHLGNVAFIGDQAPAAKRLLSQKLSSKIRAGETIDRINMEPFEVVRDMLRDGRLRVPPFGTSIGGAPQIMKVFQYSRTASFAVFWPDRNGVPHLHGRPCLSYENIDRVCFDPDTLHSVHLGSQKRKSDLEDSIDEADSDPNESELLSQLKGPNCDDGARIVLQYLKKSIRNFCSGFSGPEV
jgi:hypothetical protein